MASSNPSPSTSATSVSKNSTLPLELCHSSCTSRLRLAPFHSQTVIRPNKGFCSVILVAVPAVTISISPSPSRSPTANPIAELSSIVFHWSEASGVISAPSQRQTRRSIISRVDPAVAISISPSPSTSPKPTPYAFVNPESTCQFSTCSSVRSTPSQHKTRSCALIG